MTHAFCPHCGYDLQLDSAIMINDFMMMGSMGQLWWREHPISLPASERIICYTLMKAYPSPVRHDVILDRLDSDSESNVLDVYVHRIRKKLKEIGAPNPIVTARGSGSHGRAYIWSPEGDNELRASQP